MYRSHQYSIRFMAICLIILFTGFVLAACGGDDEEKEPAESSEKTSATESPSENEAESPAMTEEAASDMSGQETRPLVLADISDDPGKKIKRFQPLADYLAARLGDYGIDSGEVKIAPDMDTMINWIKSGEVDFYFDSLYPAMIISDSTGAIPILRRWKDGEDQYQSVFFALADSGLSTVEDLEGQMVAFDEPSSTSGYMLPVAYLIENGLNPVEKPSPAAAVGEDEVGYTFSGDDENTVQWVISGRVKAGVVDNLTYEKIPEEALSQLVILAETDFVPRQVALAGNHLDSDLIAAITTLLLELDESEEGLEVLDEFDTSQFDEFPQGAETALAQMRDMYTLVQEHNAGQ